ncbi:hypothetical protein PENSUB_7250 [Penicillium subrubescens]|uniref:Uncharacterized protein n=1 Tax=Penicillium subrubescens TaxID=1316194 RepID=A0A1Q5TNC8_9EURO|nr:hypothetical protein PENSUB_7250 [Penicillium subrubescens]
MTQRNRERNAVVFNSEAWSSITEFVRKFPTWHQWDQWWIVDPPAGSKPPINDNNVPTNPSVSNFKPSIVFHIGRKRRCPRHGDEIITTTHHNPELLATGDNRGQATTNELPQLINNTKQPESLNPRKHTPWETTSQPSFVDPRNNEVNDENAFSWRLPCYSKYAPPNRSSNATAMRAYRWPPLAPQRLQYGIRFEYSGRLNSHQHRVVTRIGYQHRNGQTTFWHRHSPYPKTFGLDVQAQSIKRISYESELSQRGFQQEDWTWLER